MLLQVRIAACRRSSRLPGLLGASRGSRRVAGRFFGWLQKLLIGTGVVRHTYQHTVSKGDPVHRITMTDSISGEQHTYSSPDQVPSEIRERIEALRSQDTEGGNVRRVTVTTRQTPQ